MSGSGNVSGQANRPQLLHLCICRHVFAAVILQALQTMQSVEIYMQISAMSLQPFFAPVLLLPQKAQNICLHEAAL